MQSSQGATQFSPDWKEGEQPSPAGSPHTFWGNGRLSPDVGGGGIRVPGTKTDQRAMSNTSALPMQGVSYKNSGFLTPHASTYLHPEENNAGRPLMALWPATPRTDGTSANRGEGTCPHYEASDSHPLCFPAFQPGAAPSDARPGTGTKCLSMWEVTERAAGNLMTEIS